MKLYQVTVDASGHAIEALVLPEEAPKNRTIRIRANSEHAAKTKAESLFSLAK